MHFCMDVETTNLEKAYLTPANQGMHSSEEVFSAKWSRICLTWTLEGVVAAQSCDAFNYGSIMIT